MRIAIDAMGTDSAPGPEVAGALLALHELPSDTHIVLVGDEGAVRAELSRHTDTPPERLHLVHAPERILPGEAPTQAFRKKPHSSIALGLRLLKERQADAFVSAGSTGAVMAGSLLTLRPLPGVDRPAIGTLLPTADRPVLMLDAGANVDCRPAHLVQFARLGHIYAQDLMGIEHPRVGLLNIGEEEEKGNEVAVETHRLLRESGLNFVGNVEGSDLIHGRCDVFVCDGFVGNVLLKFYESVAAFIAQLLRRQAEAVLKELDLEPVFRVLDYAEYGGAPLLGVNGVSVICHGRSPPKAILNAIKLAARAVETDMVGDMARELADGAPSGEER